MIRTTEDKKRIYQAMTVAGKPMDRHVGEVFKISDVVQFETDVNRKDRETGEEVTEKAVATSIFADDGSMYTTVSPTVAKCLEALHDIFEGEIVGLAIKITNGVSNNGNKFLQIDMM